VSTGLLTPMSPATVATGAAPYGVTISSDGTSVYVVNFNSNTLSQYTRNVSTGMLTPMSPATVATGAGPYDVTVSSDGTSVYVTNSGSNSGSNTLSQYTRNTSTGVLTPMSPATVATGATPHGVAISSDGTSVYVTNYSDGTLSQYTRN